MMKNKICLTFIVILIDSLYTAEVPVVTAIEDQNTNDNYDLTNIVNCKSNEILNRDGKACEPTCDHPLPLSQCLETITPQCICLEAYIRNDVNECIPLAECPQHESSDGIAESNITSNSTTNVLTESRNVTSIDEDKTYDHIIKYLKQRLVYFWLSRGNKMQTSSGKNVSYFYNTTRSHQNSYEIYRLRLREELE